jgi:hypothetical protein
MGETTNFSPLEKGRCPSGAEGFREENTTPNRSLGEARDDNNKAKDQPKLTVVTGVLRQAGKEIRADLPRRGFTFEIFAAAFLLGILIRSLC